MLTLGLTGGVASGKSLAAKFFAELGAVVLDADRAGHEVFSEPEVRDVLVDRWGPEIVTPSGEVNRAAVAKQVFGDSGVSRTERKFLEDLLHPRIRAKLEAERSRHAAQGIRVFILDAPLLLESGWESACDGVVFVDAPKGFRQSRAAARGWSVEQFAQREMAQWPIERKRERSDWVISNAGTFEDLREQVREFWQAQVSPRILAESE